MQNQETFYGNRNEVRLGKVPADKVSIQILNEIFCQKFGYCFPCENGEAWVVARKIKPQKECKGGFSL